jgi:hypothetical protein
MLAVFHSIGSMPIENELFSKSEIEGASSVAYTFRIRSGILSGPGDFSTLRFRRSFPTSQYSRALGYYHNFQL